MHSHVHLFADIIRKGVTRIYNTKPNEKAHSPLKDFYQAMTNFKNFIEQVTQMLISIVLRYTTQILFVLDSQVERK
jgi:uncharacterized membrane protein